MVQKSTQNQHSGTSFHLIPKTHIRSLEITKQKVYCYFWYTLYVENILCILIHDAQVTGGGDVKDCSKILYERIFYHIISFDYIKSELL